MKLTGSYDIPVDKKTVWEALNDPDILKESIPGCDKFEKKSDTNFLASATNKIGPFNASFSGEVELKDINPPDNYKIFGQGNSTVGFASGEAFVELTESDGKTTLSYTVEANVGGKIAQVGSRLIDMTAKKMADIFFGKFSELVTPENKKSILPNELKNKSKSSNNKIIYFSAIIAVFVCLAIYSFYK